MKLTKDTLIEGQIIKAGTEIKIKEANSLVDKYFSLVAELKNADKSRNYSEAGMIEKELKGVGEQLQKGFDRKTFEIQAMFLDGVNRGYQKKVPAKYEVRAWNPAYDIVITGLDQDNFLSPMYDGRMGYVEGYPCRIMDRYESQSAYDSMSR